MSREKSAHNKFGLAENFVVSFFDWSILGNMGLDWFIGNAALFVS